MKNRLFILSFFCYTLVYGKTATFHVDTIQNKHEIKEMEWRINGQVLNYKIGFVTVKGHKKHLDTVLYKEKKDSYWDTLLCKIDISSNFYFKYNDCCGGFDIYDHEHKRLSGSIFFKTKGKHIGTSYLGTYAEGGILLSKRAIPLDLICHSPLLPNINWVRFSEITPCQDSINCQYETCLSTPNYEDINYSYTYNILNTYANFLYLPLTEKPMTITFHIRKKKISYH